MSTHAYLLLHGFTGGPEAWDPVVARLPAGARVIAPELGGHGGTAARAWDEEVSRLASLLEREDAQDVHVVGYSMGGRLGWALATRGLWRVTRATLIGAHPGLEIAAEREARRARDARWIALLREDGLDAFIASWEALPLFATQRALDPARRDARRALRARHTAEGLASALAHLGLAEMPPVDPARAALPVTLVVGALDLGHLALATALAPRLPDARLVRVEGAGHDVVLERPDLVAQLLREGSHARLGPTSVGMDR